MFWLSVNLLWKYVANCKSHSAGSLSSILFWIKYSSNNADNGILSTDAVPVYYNPYLPSIKNNFCYVNEQWYVESVVVAFTNLSAHIIIPW